MGGIGTLMSMARAFSGAWLLVAVASCGGSAAGHPDADAGSVMPDAGGVSCEGVDAGTSPRGDYLDMDISATGFAEHDGRAIFLVTRTDPWDVLGVGRATVVGGRFALHLSKGYQRSLSQEVLWFVDGDGDGLCTGAGGDHSGYLAVGPFDPAGSDAVAVALSDNHVRMTPQGAALCAPTLAFAEMLDIDVTASGFEAHDGRTVYLLTRSAANGAIFGAGRAEIAAGGFALHLPKAFVADTYQEVFWFVDEDADGTCAGGTDHTGTMVTSAFWPTQNVPYDLRLTDNHALESARRADVCVVMNGCQLAP